VGIDQVNHLPYLLHSTCGIAAGPHHTLRIHYGGGLVSLTEASPSKSIKQSLIAWRSLRLAAICHHLLPAFLLAFSILTSGF